jgi:hypothetical protein
MPSSFIVGVGAGAAFSNHRCERGRCLEGATPFLHGSAAGAAAAGSGSHAEISSLSPERKCPTP